MIVLESLLDIDALPWQADWYRSKVREAKGNEFGDDFRLWFTDHAQHGGPGSDPAANARTVSYSGVLQQAQRDVAAWVEQGVPPPKSTNYDVVDTQVVVQDAAKKDAAMKRRGIQPVVRLTVNGGERADVPVGEDVTFDVTIEVPPNAGTVVEAEWDFEGIGNYDDGSSQHHAPKVVLQMTHSYDAAGTYFPVVRATSQREGDPDTPWARVQNIGRVRVVVD